MACSRKDSCELFPLISINGALKIWQSFYCDGNYHTCIRYQLGLEGKPIPSSLLPNGKNLDLSSSALQEETNTDKQVEQNPSGDSSTPGASVNIGDVAGQEISEVDKNEPCSNFYLRMQTDGSADLHARIAAVLHQFGITVDMMIEKPPLEEGSAKSAIFLTDFVPGKNINEALLRIGDLEGIKSKPVCIELEKS